MKIDGKLIASELKLQLKDKVNILRSKNIIPHLAVILVGNDPSSLAYIRQKQKTADEIRVKISIFPAKRDPALRDNFQLRKLLNKLNADVSVHGIIIQRPVPINIEKKELDYLVAPQKDVDGFRSDSPYNSPIALAVLKILNWVEKDCCSNPNSPLKQNYCEPFLTWLKEKKILIIGRGETAGKPIADTFKKKGFPFTVAHNKTINFKELCLSSDIIISCVGKSNIVRLEMVRDRTILIGVGLHLENGKLKTDYDQEETAQKSAYYTPVPGGVGPVNVACLFENLIKSIQN